MRVLITFGVGAIRGLRSKVIMKINAAAAASDHSVFDGGLHGAASTRAGSKRPRAGPMPDGDVYLDGFGYADTGELETVTAVFTPAR